VFGVVGATPWHQVPLLQEGVDGVKIFVVRFGGFQKFLSRDRLNSAVARVPQRRQDVTLREQDFANFFTGIFQPENFF
jgi:hypothetical protein